MGEDLLHAFPLWNPQTQPGAWIRLPLSRPVLRHYLRPESLLLAWAVTDHAVRLNDAGTMVVHGWSTPARQFPDVSFDESVVMPNHVHALLMLPAPGDSAVELGRIIQACKRLTTNLYVDGVKRNGWPKSDGRLWQRSFHDHIVRNEADMDRLRNYIASNPALGGRSAVP